ncbi:MAG: DNA-processing protein DprA [Ardenticatenaceae bacterium]
MNTRYYLQLAKAITPATQRKVLRYLADQALDLRDFFALPPSDWGRAGLTTTQVNALVAAEAHVPAWERELKARDIQVVGWLDAVYPKRLKQAQQATPILCAWGNLGLLSGPAIGFSGARQASFQGIQVTKDTVQQITNRGFPVVSGHAKGIDVTAHETALLHKGATIIVPVEGILNFRLRRQLKPLARSDNVLILSPFLPHAEWSSANAMIRNRIICALSDALVVVEAGLKGGAFATAHFAWRMNTPLFLPDYAQPSASALGNPYFIRRGALPLRRNRKSGRANLVRLFNEVISHYRTVTCASETKLARPTQLSLFALSAT